MGWRPVFLIACHALLLYLAAVTGYQLVVWAVSLATLSTLNFEPFITFMVRLEKNTQDEHYTRDSQNVFCHKHGHENRRNVNNLLWQ